MFQRGRFTFLPSNEKKRLLTVFPIVFVCDADDEEGQTAYEGSDEHMAHGENNGQMFVKARWFEFEFEFGPRMYIQSMFVRGRSRGR